MGSSQSVGKFVALSSYYECMVRERDPGRLPAECLSVTRGLSAIYSVFGKTNSKSMVLKKYGDSCCVKVFELRAVQSQGC